MAKNDQNKWVPIFFASLCGFGVGVAYWSHEESKAREDLWKRIPKNIQERILEQYKKEELRHDQDPNADVDYQYRSG